MSDWRPIETAPKDGTRLLGYYPQNEDYIRVGVIQWMKPRGYDYHWTWDGSWMPDDPTHWQPLPEPPQ